jgi:hypothetical protein
MDDVVSGRAEPRDQILFHAKPAVIGGDSHVHAAFSALWHQRSNGSGPIRAAASWSASTRAWC